MSLQRRKRVGYMAAVLVAVLGLCFLGGAVYYSYDPPTECIPGPHCYGIPGECDPGFPCSGITYYCDQGYTCRYPPDPLSVGYDLIVGILLLIIAGVVLRANRPI